MFDRGDRADKTRGELPDSWLSGHALIDGEHRLLAQILASAPSLCNGYPEKGDCTACGSPLQEICEARLVDLLGELIEYSIDHFASEELLMRRSFMPIVHPDQCEAHFEDHAEIMGYLTSILASLRPELTAAHLHRLMASLQQWLDEHVTKHDQPLAEWLSQHKVGMQQI